MTANPAHPLDRPGIEQLQLEKLRLLLAVVRKQNPFYAAKLRDAQPATELRSLDEFAASIPFTYKREIVDDQAQHPPYGTNLSYPVETYTRFTQTSGTTGRPIRWLDTRDSWAWMVDNWTRIYEAAGAVPGDRVFFPFSFGPFLGFWLGFEAAAQMGCLAISGGGMRSAARLQAIVENEVTVLCSTPSYAIHLAEVAREEGVDLRACKVRAIVVAGEPGGSIPATRRLIEELWPGARVSDHHGMTEIGPVTYECPSRPGTLHVMEGAYFAEVLDPSTFRPVGAGESGELTLTNLGRLGSPLLRYRTGDIVCRAKEPLCACGSAELALDGGILARLDDMVIVRGVNVYPSAVEEILRSCGILEFRVELDTGRSLTEMNVQIESGTEDPEVAERRVSGALNRAFGFRVPVVCRAAGELPRFEAKAKRWIRI